MPYNSLPRCAHPGCTKLPVVQVYGFRHNEYDDYCEEHQGHLMPMITEYTLLEARVAALEREIAALKAREG